MTRADEQSAEAATARLATEITALLDSHHPPPEKGRNVVEVASVDMPEAAQPERQALQAFARLLAPLTLSPPVTIRPKPARLPVCRHLAAALRQATGEAVPLATAVEALIPVLTWTQNPNYRRSPPSPGFLDRYGYAVIAGPEGGAPALMHHRDLAFGVLLLGPQTAYPAHRHPASEIYIPLGPAEWMMGGGDFAPREPGAVIYHRPNLVHATRTAAEPLAALYLWAGDLATYARIVP